MTQADVNRSTHTTHLDVTACFFSSSTNALSSAALAPPALLLLSALGVRYTGPSMPYFGTNTMRPFAFT